jgi:hypothetical protein
VVDDEYQAFLSYSHADDAFLEGAISWLRQELQRASKAVTGREFKIFQDRDGIAFGEDWQERLDKALESTVVMLPILTPSFFASDACCSEVSKFLDYEKRKGRNDLILPIYLIDTKIDDDSSDSHSDHVARILMERQHRDWRRIAFDLKGSQDIKLRIARLAREIDEAMEDRKTSNSTVRTRSRNRARTSLREEVHETAQDQKMGDEQRLGGGAALEVSYQADAIITLSRNKTVIGPNPITTMKNFVLFMNHFFEMHQADVENDRLFIWVIDLGNRLAQTAPQKEEPSDFTQFFNAGTLALYLKAFQSFDLEQGTPIEHDRIVPHLSIPDPAYRTSRWSWLRDRSVIFVRNLRLDELQEVYGDEDKMLGTVQLKDIGITVEHLLPRERPPESWRTEMRRVYGKTAQTASATITAFFREAPWTSSGAHRNIRYFAHRERSRSDEKVEIGSPIDQTTQSVELPSPGHHQDTALQLLYWGARYRLGQMSDIEIETGIHSLAYLKGIGFRALRLNHFMDVFSHS